MTESSESSSRTSKKVPPVYRIVSRSRCYECDACLEPGSIVLLRRAQDEKEVLCVACAHLDNLEFLPGNNAKATQLAKKNSARTFVVMQWSALWKCYERQGLLVEASALDLAESALGIKLPRQSLTG
jgi:hypothetical protein